jgi:PEGA domain
MELTALSAAGAANGTGGLQIATEPSGARVSIDGEPRGVSPLTVSNLKVGDHVVTVRNSLQTVNRTVAVGEGAVASLIISMNAMSAPSAAFASGWLTVTSGVPMQVLENGTLVGTTEMSRILLPAGDHELELVNAALSYRVSRSVQITAGQTATLGLKPPMGTLSINALPWAEVFVDGQRAGETPIGNLSIVVGNHEVLFRHPELGEQRRTVTVGALSPARVGVDMKKP